jgi:hypothetical protein
MNEVLGGSQEKFCAGGLPVEALNGDVWPPYSNDVE